MGGLGPEERSAIDAIVRHFSATWNGASDRRGAHLRLGGRRIVVEVRALEPPHAMGDPIAKPRLRYDRVALRFLREMRERLLPLLARREAAIVTIRAPILQAGKTLDALEEKFRARRFGATGLTTRAFGNQIGIRFVRDGWRGAEVLGFVHSAGSSPAIIANAARSLMECLHMRTGRAVAAGEGRWLVLLGTSALGEICRDVASQLRNAAPFEKIVLLAEGARVETVAG